MNDTTETGPIQAESAEAIEIPTTLMRLGNYALYHFAHLGTFAVVDPSQPAPHGYYDTMADGALGLMIAAHADAPEVTGALAHAMETIRHHNLKIAEESPLQRAADQYAVKLAQFRDLTAQAEAKN